MEGPAELMAESCDFCGAANAAWIYPAASFIMESVPTKDVGSDGAWAACGKCHDLIESNDREALAAWALKNFQQRHGALPREYRQVLGERMRSLHIEFWNNRQGKPLPIGTPFDGETQRSKP